MLKLANIVYLVFFLAYLLKKDESNLYKRIILGKGTNMLIELEKKGAFMLSVENLVNLPYFV